MILRHDLNGKGPSDSILALNFEGKRIRFVGTSDVPEWVAVDVCDCMGIDNVSRAVSDFDDDEKGIRNLHTLGGKQTLITLYESGL